MAGEELNRDQLRVSAAEEFGLPAPEPGQPTVLEQDLARLRRAVKTGDAAIAIMATGMDPADLQRIQGAFGQETPPTTS